MRRLLIAAAAALTVLTVPAPAQADVWPDGATLFGACSLTGNHAIGATEGQSQKTGAISRGMTFWHNRGIYPPANYDVIHTTFTGCSPKPYAVNPIYGSSSAFSHADWNANVFSNFTFVCKIVVHEMGHSAGLRHYGVTTGPGIYNTYSVMKMHVGDYGVPTECL